jgi:hypothetical protein
MTSTRLQIIDSQSIDPFGRRGTPTDAIMWWPRIITSIEASRTAAAAVRC